MDPLSSLHKFRGFIKGHALSELMTAVIQRKQTYIISHGEHFF